MGSPLKPQPDANLFVGLLRRWPYQAALITSFLLLICWDACRNAFPANGDRTWLNWVAVAFIAYGVGVSLFFVPRCFVPRARGRGLAQLAWLRWALAISPSMIALGLWTAGADQWVATTGLVVSVLLLFLAARENDQ